MNASFDLKNPLLCEVHAHKGTIFRIVRKSGGDLLYSKEMVAFASLTRLPYTAKLKVVIRSKLKYETQMMSGFGRKKLSTI